MWLITLVPFLAKLASALPQNVADACTTVTTAVVIPTTTATYKSTPVVTVHETTPKDLGTFTHVTTISSTTTIGTVTSTSIHCTAQTQLAPRVTVYASAPTNHRRSPLELEARACTVTVTTTTHYGQTQTFVQVSGVTSTYSDYTEFTMATITQTKYNGKAYAMASAVATTDAQCGSTNSGLKPTSTVTMDARCAPSAMTSAYNGFGIDYADNVPAGGATYTATTDDASQCCQLCAESQSCAASSWDIRNHRCVLEFPVDPNKGTLNCGEGILAFYNAGPNHPMKPGTGLFVRAMCGDVEFGNTKPDDGS
ncbi:hypothetical protein K470DRAFT_254120 [Piedraia hortae CBS 480.64]|uniref:Apple domain-containing protein n=1 Tax=Piedraia hortae CBS 480.64 TaxID=1314780 RepID=A0A6A7CAL2_9PEZI|nr:hypothetical protein K470DRAFT_254120 [Piedraia hortae CBS 480.64]